MISVPRRERYLISLCLTLITVLAWAYLINLSRHPSSADEYAQMMAQMGMAIDRPWTAVDAFFTFAMWTVMMVGMMSAAAAPMLLLFAGAQAARSQRRVPLNLVLFAIGYLAIWAGFSAIATAAQWLLQRAALLSAAMSASQSWFAGVILAAAGAYQLTPIKGACLTLCRSPLGFLMTNWRDGAIGAFRMGARHGLFCVGCCWALMIVLFAVGIMNLMWVAALTAIVLIEKLTPAGVLVSRASGLAMIAASAYAFLKP
jgi:predicted metal-binding membrane protein